MGAIRLECFGATEATRQTTLMTLAEIEDLRHEAQQEGYRRGKEDAEANAEAARNAQNDAIIQQLQDLAFTYHEARQALLAEISPLMLAISRQILPDMARLSLAPRLAEMVLERLAEEADCPVRIYASGDVLQDVRARISGADALPIDYIEVESSFPAAASVTFAAQEKRLDLGDLVARIDAAFVSCFTPTSKVASHD